MGSVARDKKGNILLGYSESCGKHLPRRYSRRSLSLDVLAGRAWSTILLALAIWNLSCGARGAGRFAAGYRQPLGRLQLHAHRHQRLTVAPSGTPLSTTWLRCASTGALGSLQRSSRTASRKILYGQARMYSNQNLHHRAFRKRDALFLLRHSALRPRIESCFGCRADCSTVLAVPVGVGVIPSRR